MTEGMDRVVATAKFVLACRLFAKLRRPILGASAEVRLTATDTEESVVLSISDAQIRLVEGNTSRQTQSSHGDVVVVRAGRMELAHYLAGSTLSITLMWTGKIAGPLVRLSVLAGTLESVHWNRALHEAQLQADDLAHLFDSPHPDHD